ncbi:hypothetical protein Salat_0240200 [Sesamum alatum]|uniref:Uncharacterized protein n=1 Tax=Sesamum alatum TaxID=300844 RepID=A0AAE2CYG5_9LAMI|nr:hypothetical protein Salat_0240200 [Sesamum alatum]
MGGHYHLLLQDPLSSLPLSDPTHLTIGGCKHLFNDASTITIPYCHLSLLMQPGHLVDLSPISVVDTCRGSLISNNKTPRRAKELHDRKHSSKTPITNMATSSNACTIGS